MVWQVLSCVVDEGRPVLPPLLPSPLLILPEVAFVAFVVVVVVVVVVV